MTEENPEVIEKVFVQLGTKINIGNYESMDVSFGVSGIPINSSPEYLEAVAGKAMGTVNTLLNYMYGELANKIKAIKDVHGV